MSQIVPRNIAKLFTTRSKNKSKNMKNPLILNFTQNKSQECHSQIVYDMNWREVARK